MLCGNKDNCIYFMMTNETLLNQDIIDDITMRYDNNDNNV